jgi:GNAT superfamily N-acetyltransferase
VNVVEIVDPAERSRICSAILRTVPEWFGIESATQGYIDGVAGLPTFVARDDRRDVGFLSLKQHGERSAEIWVMAVIPEWHRRGAGRALVEAAERHLSKTAAQYLQVKTLGPSDPDEGYARTRAFYEAVGFVPLEELHDLWDSGNPALILVKKLS